jgi:hypothetical protein
VVVTIENGIQYSLQSIWNKAFLKKKRKEKIEIPSLHWSPEGKRKRGRAKNTWRRTVEGEMRTMNNIWGTVEKMAKERQKGRTFVAALHANGISGSK